MNLILEDAESRMKSALQYLHEQYVSIRAGRANTAILNGIKVNYYNTETPLDQIAVISIAESRIIVIQPWDISLLPTIEKAIQKSDIGINPQNDGKAIRLVFPPLSESRRKEISKEISHLAEEAKISIRNIRRDGIDRVKILKKKSEITEDELKMFEKKIQDFTDKFCANIDKLCSEKTNQIMEI